MTREHLKDIVIPFEIVEPKTYEEFCRIFPRVFDELENPDHIIGNHGLRSLSVDFMRLRKALGLVGNKRKKFVIWMTKFLEERHDLWDLHGGTALHYSEMENLNFEGRRWILISRRWRECNPIKDPRERTT